ncbi:MAG: hypothetical protein WDA27_02850 [Actinomycetota bacterium]
MSVRTRLVAITIAATTLSITGSPAGPSDVATTLFAAGDSLAGSLFLDGGSSGTIDFIVQESGHVVGSAGARSGAWFDAVVRGAAIGGGYRAYAGALSAGAVAIDPTRGGRIDIPLQGLGTLRLSFELNQPEDVRLGGFCWRVVSPSREHVWGITFESRDPVGAIGSGTLGHHSVSSADPSDHYLHFLWMAPTTFAHTWHDVPADTCA